MQLTSILIIFCVILAIDAVPVENEAIHFEVKDIWNKIPDLFGNFVFLHKSQIVTSEPENKYTAESDVIFALFTKQNSEVAQNIILENLTSLEASNFNPLNPTRIIIHGWLGSFMSISNIAAKDAYLSVGEFNVISVDWSAGAKSDYITTRNRVDATGLIVARFLDFLVKEGGQTLTQIYVIGYSLGANIASVVGKNVTVGKVHTIFGLDPAGMLFYADSNANERFDVTDAEYVELIITNGRNIGMETPLGHANFYVNDGSTQPGCDTELCSHERSVHFFAESINSTAGFWSNQCKNCKELATGNCVGEPFPMGGEPSLHGAGVQGIFHLNTNAVRPFALGKNI